MKYLKLTRQYFKNFTVGKLWLNYNDNNGNLICKTIELPNKENKKNISCIPTGKYIVKKHISPKHKTCLKVYDFDGKHEVNGRADILIHAANMINFNHDNNSETPVITELEGCIAPCSNVILKDGGVFGENSRENLKKLLKIVGDNSLELVIE